MQKKFIIEGITCASCVMVNENSLNNLKGVSKVSINLATRQATLEFDEKIVSFEDIKKEIEKNGFKVNKKIEVNKKDEKEERDKTLQRFILSLIFSLPVVYSMFGTLTLGKTFLGVDYSMFILALFSAIVVFIFGGHFHKSAYKSLLKLRFNMDSLVSLGTLTALIYSVIAMFFEGLMVYFEAAVAIITLINLGKYLEYRAKSSASDAIGKLIELGAKKAFVLVGEKIVEKDIDDVEVGEVVVIKAGEKIPLDGIVLAGTASIDESMITGESIPVFKEQGSECFGGTINLDGAISIKVTKQNKEGTLANIIKLVDQAQSSKAPIQHLVDKVSSVFVPAIIVIAIITFIGWYFYSGNLNEAVINSVAVLVIACPCALGLATPTAIMVGIGVGARNGILIKDVSALEKTKDIDVVVFDKTGTLTKGKPELTDIIDISRTKDEVLSYAKSLASLSTHPLSKSIVGYDEKVEIFEVKNFEEIKGKGLIGELNGEVIKLGNKNWLKHINENIGNYLDEITTKGKTPILVGNDKEIFGIIGLIDIPKLGVRGTINEIHDMGIEVIMLTGDTKNTANYVAGKLGIDKVFAEVLPADKLGVIKELQSQGKIVAFVGDGINDAPALMQSDLAIAMGTGSDIAIESSQIVLVKGNLEKVVSAINLSRQTLKIIKQNLFWAFLYNTIGIPLAAFGVLSPIFASFAMSMSSVSVVSNSLRLRKFRGD